MQINSAQDYLTLKKRQIIAATFTQNPPPVKGRNNTIVTALLANKATGYEKVPYAISLAPGTAPGPAYVFPGLRPTVNNCCIQPMASAITTPVTYTYYPNLTGTTGNTVGTLLTNATVINGTRNYGGGGAPQMVIDTLGNIYYYCPGDGKIYKIVIADTTTTILTALTGVLDLGPTCLIIDSSNNLYFTANIWVGILKINSVTGATTTIVTQAAMSAAMGNNYGIGGIILDELQNLYFVGNSKLYQVTQAGVITQKQTVGMTENSMFFDSSAKIVYGQLITGGGYHAGNSFTLSGGVAGVGTYFDTGTYTYLVAIEPTYKYFINYNANYQLFTTNVSTRTTAIIAGASGTGSMDGSASSAQFGTSSSYGTCGAFGKDGTFYFADLGNNSIRTIKGPAVTVSPAVITYYPNAGALI